MGFGHAIQQHVDELRKKGANVPKILAEAQKAATDEAIQRAVDMTPPNADTPLRGTNMSTGTMQGHWEDDSEKEPKISGKTYTTVLANNASVGNNASYASYVNDGHRVDMHFVRGLNINPHTGLLEISPTGEGGIIVGTKTRFVPGIYMKQHAVTTYRRVLEDELRKRIKELFGT